MVYLLRILRRRNIYDKGKNCNNAKEKKNGNNVKHLLENCCWLFLQCVQIPERIKVTAERHFESISI